jgi:hypothetical protein
MGWSQSPPIFTAATETVADLANQHLQQRLPTEPHRLDHVSETAASPPGGPAIETPSSCQTQRPLPVPPHQRNPRGRPIPVKQWDVYVDDFIGLVQGGPHHHQHVKRALLATLLDTVFWRLSPSDGPFRQEPASIKKMLKGDATWATRKDILGWTVDTLQMTIELPPPSRHSAFRHFGQRPCPPRPHLC